MAIRLTLAVPQNAPADAEPTVRFFADPTATICVEATPGRFVHQQVQTVVVGDKICQFGPPNPGPGSEVALVEVV